MENTPIAIAEILDEIARNLINHGFVEKEIILGKLIAVTCHIAVTTDLPFQQFFQLINDQYEDCTVEQNKSHL